MNKTSTLVIGGKERTLLFSSLGIMEYIEEQVNKDPFEWLQGLVKSSGVEENGVTKDVLKVVKDIRVIIYGALNCHLDSIDGERIPFEKVNRWCTPLTEKEYGEVFRLFALAIQNKSEGEAAALASGA